MSDAPATRIQPTTLPRIPDLAPAEDFAALKSQALTWLPDWCYDRWTDFNDHDPGIMILEQVIYASTEMPYRARLPVDQLLQNSAGKIPWDENSLFAPPKILPTAPLTAADYARLLYDQVPTLLYARVEPLKIQDFTLAPSVRGRLSASIAIDPDATQSAVKQALYQAGAVLSRHCNLGERFEQVLQQHPVTFTVQMVVELTSEADAGKVAADLYLTVKNTLLPGPRFRTLAKARDTETLDVALSGPLLERGIIEDQDMPRLWTWAEARELTAHALLTDTGHGGVVTQIMFPGETTQTDPQLFLPGPVVTVNELTDASTPSGKLRRSVTISFARMKPLLTISAGNAPAPAATDQTNALIGLGGENPVVQFSKLLTGSSWLMPAIPDEPATEIGEYQSLQNHFPRCFALGQDALSPNATPQRRSQVRQLKGYLLVFEQLIANYFAQLAHTSDYFSNRPQTRTLFTQPLAHVPEVMPLLGGYTPPGPGADPTQNARAAARFWNDTANPYIQGLHAIAESPGHFHIRRTRVLDHLLARFNESFPLTNLSTFETIVNKESLLQSYPDLSLRRAQAAHTGDPGSLHKPRPRSGLEEKIQLLLRRDNQHTPALLSQDTDCIQLLHPDDFYFVFESIRFLPTQDAPPAAAAGTATTAIPLTAFAPTLFHVFINWTYAPLNSAFTDYAEALVRDNAPAHLWHQFIWLETRGDQAAGVRAFLLTFRDWVTAGFAPLACPAPAETDAPAPATPDSLTVVADTPAAKLLGWLLTQTATPGPGVSIS